MRTSRHWRCTVRDLREVWFALIAREFGRPLAALSGTAASSPLDLYLQHMFCNGVSASEAEHFVSLFPKTPEYEHDRVRTYIQLLRYARHTEEWGMYGRLVRRLYDVHNTLGNYTEAGHCLLLEADREPERPGEVSEARTRLVVEAVALLERGKQWEKTQQLLSARRLLHETLGGPDDFWEAALAEMEAKQRHLVDTQDRFEDAYFFVEFFGRFRGLPAHRSGHAHPAFVYRGGECERLGNFTAKLRGRFPGARIVLAKDRAGIANSELQHIVIRTCTPVEHTPEEFTPLPVSAAASRGGGPPRTDGDGRNRARLSPRNSAQQSLQRCRSEFGVLREVSVFEFRTPFRRPAPTPPAAPPAPSNEWSDMWVEHTYVLTEDSFPTVSRSSPVVAVHRTEISPVENAAASVAEKNAQLEKFIDEIGRTGAWTNRFSGLLDGTIDAAVSGGITRLIDVFFAEDWPRSNPGRWMHRARLAAALRKQVCVVRAGLELHARVMPAELMGALHRKMEAFFVRFAAMVARVEGVFATTCQRAVRAFLRRRRGRAMITRARRRVALIRIWKRRDLAYARALARSEPPLRELAELHAAIWEAVRPTRVRNPACWHLGGTLDEVVRQRGACYEAYFHTFPTHFCHARDGLFFAPIRHSLEWCETAERLEALAIGLGVEDDVRTLARVRVFWARLLEKVDPKLARATQVQCRLRGPTAPRFDSRRELLHDSRVRVRGAIGATHQEEKAAVETPLRLFLFDDCLVAAVEDGWTGGGNACRPSLLRVRARWMLDTLRSTAVVDAVLPEVVCGGGDGAGEDLGECRGGGRSDEDARLRSTWIARIVEASERHCSGGERTDSARVVVARRNHRRRRTVRARQ